MSDFISVTYGAESSTRKKTVEIASRIRNDFGREALAHLICVQATGADIIQAFLKNHLKIIPY